MICSGSMQSPLPKTGMATSAAMRATRSQSATPL
jgi:hypothetical protein